MVERYAKLMHDAEVIFGMRFLRLKGRLGSTAPENKDAKLLFEYSKLLSGTMVGGTKPETRIVRLPKSGRESIEILGLKHWVVDALYKRLEGIRALHSDPNRGKPAVIVRGKNPLNHIDYSNLSRSEREHIKRIYKQFLR